MTGLDSIAGSDSGSDNRGPLLRLIRDSRVVRELRKRGYTTVSFASGYTGTDLANADVHFAPRWSLSEFQNVVISTTPLPLVLDRVLRKSQYDLHRERILYALEHLPDAARLKHPVFVFAHILSPHPPFVFGPGGRKIDPKGYFTITEGGYVQGRGQREGAARVHRPVPGPTRVPDRQGPADSWRASSPTRRGRRSSSSRRPRPRLGPQLGRPGTGRPEGANGHPECRAPSRRQPVLRLHHAPEHVPSRLRPRLRRHAVAPARQELVLDRHPALPILRRGRARDLRRGARRGRRS